MTDKFADMTMRESMRRSADYSTNKPRFGQKIDQTPPAESFFNADAKSLRGACDESDDEISANILRLIEKYRASYGKEEEKNLSDYLERHNLHLRISPSVDKTEKSEIARILFDGVLKKPLDARSMKPHKQEYKPIHPLGCSPKFIEALNNSSAPTIDPAGYDMSASYLWKLFAQVPEFAAMEDKIRAGLAKAHVPQETLAGLNMTDFKYLLYYNCGERTGRGDGPSYLFVQKDEQGRPLRDEKGRYITTSRKKENVKAFIKKNKKDFSRKMMSVNGINKEYLKALVERMEKDGCTDMSYSLKDHSEWKNQPSINVHHVVNIKDCQVIEDSGRPFYEVNNLDNMCFVTNGTIEESLDRNNRNFKGNVHKLLHATDFEFDNSTKTFKKPKVAIRIEPRKGVCAMMGFVNHHVIVNESERENVSQQWRQQQYDALASKQQTMGRDA